jgi:two-component system, chemotaxis family, sensor kinase CheA
LRMQTVEGLFQRLERTARDIAREQQKSVVIKLQGAETPLDRTVIEFVTDPLMHIVRNAIDHGLESDEERKRNQKSVPAFLTIRTHHDNGQVVVSISDDGRGIDPALVLEKAIKQGLVPQGQELKEHEIIQLLFLPGFSTKEQITHISGRGVGLDVVQKSIQQLGGHIEIHSQKGKGTVFNIRLPATLEIIDGLLIRVGNQVFVAPRREIEEIADLDTYEIESLGRGNKIIRMRKAIVPLEDLKDYIGLPPGAHAGDFQISSYLANDKTDNDRYLEHDIALVIRLSDQSRLALRVDTILAQQQIVVRPISESFIKLPGFTGMTILGNGEPAMILSTSEIGSSYLKWVNRGTQKDKDSA